MMRSFRVDKSYQLIQTIGRFMQRKRKFWLFSAILSSCFFGALILTAYNTESTKDVEKMDYLFEGAKLPLARFSGTIKESSPGLGEKIENVHSLRVADIPLLTFFTSWIDQKDKYVVQNRTIETWKSFGPHVHPVIFTNDTKLGSQCRQRGWSVLPLKHTAAGGVPILKYMYLATMQNFHSAFYGFSNSDILFNDGLITTLVSVREFIEVNRCPVLITGRRTNVDYKLPCNASDWRNITSVSKKGKLANPLSADYFITTKDYPWEEMEEIIIGRMRTDNWIIQFSQLKNVTVINSTPTVIALHQTTETGNYESASKKYKFYIVDIVHKFRNMTINMYEGQTDCAEYVTNFTRSGLVRVVRQTQQIICKGFVSSKAETRIFHILLMQWMLCCFVLLINK